MTMTALMVLATVWTYWNHEPADHLRRMSYSNPTVFTTGEWLHDWYERLHGDKLIGEAADLGVDTVYCHFFKGFGLVHEKAEMARTRDFVKNAHAKGVKVLGYCQLNSLYYETMLGEFPDLENWVGRRYDGKLLTYGHYCRWSPCFESREFMDYLKRVIRYGLEEIGLDGFHFDNSYSRDCFCDRCQAAFRAWLAANVPDPRAVCGLADFRHVRLSPTPFDQEAAGQELHDPIMVLRSRFRADQLARAHREIFGYVKTFGKEKLVLHNPAFGRPHYPVSEGDMALEPWESVDFLMAENNRYIRVQDGRIRSQVAAYKLGRRFGFRVFDSTWVSRKEVDWLEPRTDIPRDAATMNRYYAEGMIYGDIVGNPWLVRSAKEGDRVILDDPVQRETAANAFGFFRRHEADLFAGKPVAKAHLLYVTDTFYGWTYCGAGLMSFFDAGETLNAAGAPWTIVTPGDIASLGSGELLVLPDVRFMRKSLYEALVAAGSRGVKILPTGKAGLYDENGIARAASNPICDLKGVPNKVSEIPDEFRVKASAPLVMAETQVNAKGELVLHLLRPDNETVLPELTVSFADPRAAGRVTLHSFEKECSITDTRFEEGRRTVVLRDFRTMASVTLSGKLGMNFPKMR